MKKIACLFPGIGYTCDKPLMYYSWKMLSGQGWEIVPLSWSGLPDKAKGNPEKTQLTVHIALEQAEEKLQDTDWSRYDEILFIGKSLGTVVCAAYAKRHGLRCRQVLFTPVEATFQFAGRDSIAFHGTADPLADTRTIEACCRRLDIPLYETEGANHSLETGDIDRDIKEMRKVMKTVRAFIGQNGEEET